ncbi:MAG: polyribonucleotide nucleotidyltransferase [Candidatus Staskawiczbacteria bacterium RIFOXYD2_FULL_37_9]|uniref:Polyribonucleotide nucleotidyltransferase n=1 Tax=Candidatus Staskawiczbacteria bacterium RIFOXYB1_FULL_37_44 TaxID=1802223 RepID=A0A1G2ITM9_9BACT|nr:MAG: polyribonucleotide nucleotidyltransferase [Candidatus Staskawiczbacteria bacterium RIFOXYB1_FULL_37_44]OGZ84295.1 MAG: polyribonucleotide nucleotidyltransferase [Candidatus Staskawiczbacteria bacterium RIFOXYC1_FULL_37_52]OGZ89144.1 MAG: polyribonucleotide nucleotidyltransferase [Candidatus Staskawiczbacteria bacterium RIFOXYD1_FULL_37_110]OGZ89429.1 MAG: polyribonucleotide nucleotidyltransferase [Candidatus Staskawiczbacteria bacterium RIFOXYC2_FULL_37_19]OGZ93820.1 MAG: polyribonucleo
MIKDTFEIKVGEKPIIIKTTNWTEQASGSCLVSCGETEVLVTAVLSPFSRPDIDYFPLTVEYEERFYAAGKIFGSRFMKRESRPTEDAILTARMIDRAIRPLFPKDFKKEVQVVVTCLSWDGENDPDILGMIGASFALAISNIPWNGPLGAIRVTKNGEWKFNSNYLQRKESDMDLTLSAIEKDGDILINMIEMGAKEVLEKDVLEAYEIAKKEIKEMIEVQLKAVKKIGKEKDVFEPAVELDIENEIKEWLGDRLEKAINNAPKSEKNLGSAEILKQELIKYLAEKHPGEGKEKQVLAFFEKEIEKIIIKNIIEKDYRPDGRKSTDIRPLSCEVAVLPRAHGSGVFFRGLTRVLSILTLGGPGDQQILEGMEFVGKKRFLHHYNFPPFSSGETAPMRGPKRREIGHGALVEKALLPMLPTPEQFPYTIRIVSEVVSSNGSTSQASVCAACVALMDAGVPIKEPVAGISVGLAKDEKSGKYKLLTDIQGPEDHYGDMDFKVAGTKNGITAIQMDIKIDGIDKKIMEEALTRAKDARLKILDIIKEQIPESRKNLSPYAPKIISFMINPSKIGEVVGPKGSMINKIIEECNGVAIDIEDSGLVAITGQNQADVDKAANWIKGIVKEIEVGEVFQGTVRKIMEFGAFVDILGGQSGLVHISKFVPQKIDSVKDVVREGDVIPVKVMSIDELGRINLSAIDAGFKPKSKNSK